MTEVVFGQVGMAKITIHTLETIVSEYMRQSFFLMKPYC